MVEGAVRPVIFVACALTAVACGESGSGTGRSAAPETAGSANVAGGGGIQAGSGGLSGSAGRIGGAPGGAGGAGSAAIDPEITRRYSWTECGRISAPANSYEISSLDIDASGRLLVSNAGIATAWRVDEPFETSQALWAKGAEGAYNTDVSEDGRMVAVSGDVRVVYDAESGEPSSLEQPPPPEVDLDSICIFTEYRFSPDGRYVAGKHYDTRVEVLETTGFTRVAELETNDCGQGLTFLSDAIITPEGAFSTATWTATSPLRPSNTRGLPPPCYIYLDPDHAQPTVCCNDGCETSFASAGGKTLSGGRHPRFSRENHWVVSGGTLLHLPSGETRSFDPEATEALFAPNGDVIAGEHDGSLVRFCRSE
ncbi:MAG TPA: hypothetical protein VF103_14005 [Polyangiaceae bacterium]